MFGIVLFIKFLVDAYTLCVLNSYHTVLNHSDLNVVGALSILISFYLAAPSRPQVRAFQFPHYLAIVKASPGNCEKINWRL